MIALDDEALEFFMYQEEPYEALEEVNHALSVADQVALQFIPMDDGQMGVSLIPVFLIRDPKVVTEFLQGLHSYVDEHGKIVYVDFLDEFHVGNVKSFYLTLEYIVETF